MATLNRIYSDIDFTFMPKPVTGDVALSYDQQAVIRSVRNLLLTNHFERPFNPDLGSNLNALLFENISPSLTVAIQNEIMSTISNYEPRALVKTVAVSVLPDQNSYSATITFYIANATIPTTVTVLLKRDR
jgi:phage baseplate assembly protein W